MRFPETSAPRGKSRAIAALNAIIAKLPTTDVKIKNGARPLKIC
jgi:hypothetical protein